MQSRLSPFANTKGREGKKKQKHEDEEEKRKNPKETCSQANNKKMKELKKWFSLIDATTFSKNKIPAKKLQSSLYLNKQLHKTLYGFIVFEVEWDNVRGINYLNELQVLPLQFSTVLLLLFLTFIYIFRQTLLSLLKLICCGGGSSRASTKL